MRLSVAAIGRLRGGPEYELVSEYSARIRAAGRGIGFTSFEILEMESPKGLAGAKRRQRESALLDQTAGSSAVRVILDEKGKSLTSADFASQLGQWRDNGAKELFFLIGGADGHEKSFLETADLTFAFGKATFPHMLVRIMLVEQIYRAVTLLAGHPYHRE